MIRQSTVLKLTIGLLLWTIVLNVNAAIIPFHTRISTTTSTSGQVQNVPIGTSGFVKVTLPWTGAFRDVVVSNRITFGVDHANMTFVTLAGEVKVRLKIEQWKVNDNPNSTGTISFEELTINYQPFSNTIPYIDKSVFTFNGAYQFRITIDGITQNLTPINILPVNLVFDADIMLERYYDFSINANSSILSPGNPMLLTPVDLDCDAKYDELEITWPAKVGAEEYQLEWTFVNDYDLTLGPPYTVPSSLSFNFRNNSTRITTVKTNYKITLTFEHGYILFRIRGIGRNLNQPEQHIAGVWSEPDKGKVSAAGSFYYNIREHEGDKNWQYSATYAEEGKLKEVISYFDGGLRNRQSVTKVNSDNNTIVGQTIYDAQGRPAINVLPVPVQIPTCTNLHPLQYFPAFNQDDSLTTHPYTWNDFDVDVSAADSCTARSGAMSMASGASNYYSPANPNMNGAQAFVPDGEKYPFTQVEYTRDNTGRISRQGGVGPKYQLGSGHETRYYYGTPNQIQLDRLFGPEVGDQAHYKKNVIVDANGQVSVSYLDQEGRTIATSLAGDAPKDNNNVTILAPLASETSAQKTLTIDLFSKNAQGISKVNVRNEQDKAIVFNSQMLVTYESEYEFDYDLKIDDYQDNCLMPDDVCLHCVYDLEIKVTDDCGRIITPMTGFGSLPVNKTIGYFTTGANGEISFNRDCNAPSPYDHHESFKLNLPIGNYTISKILTVNQDARDFYVATYLDSNYNECVKTLYDFQKEYLLNVDTSDCRIDCKKCLESLMTIDGTKYSSVEEARDHFVAAGEGTELEFDFLMEECGAPCKKLTWCEATYQQLLIDVSPDGQYAEFQNSYDGKAPDLSLSVLHTGNILPVQSSFADPPNWKHPLLDVNGNDHKVYLDENGNPSIIKLTPDGANYIPKVDNPSAPMVKWDPTGNFFYTSPENLADVDDFVNNWKASWAKSLVQYHPEYCYYKSCHAYSILQPGNTLTSDSFDLRLLNANTYLEAVNAGLISPSYAGQAPSDIRVMAKFIFPLNGAQDPFIKTVSYGQQLYNAFLQYKNLNGTNYSMVEIAANTARCGTSYGVAINATGCGEFGKQGVATAILDQEWNLLKNSYMSEKRKIQQQLADDKARLSCYGYNGCIGDSNYNPFVAGMFNFSFSNYSSSPFFNDQHPCSASRYPLFVKKVKRFIGPENIPVKSPEETDYQMYQLTGQCPLAIHWQYLISALAAKGDLDNTVGVPLKDYAEFTPDLYAEVNGGIIPGIFVPYTWKANTLSGNILTGHIVNTSNTSGCSFVLDKSGTAISTWDQIVSVSGLKYITTVGSNYEFEVMAVVISSGGATTHEKIKGATSVKIAGCTFSTQNSTNQLTLDLGTLMSVIQINQPLNTTSQLALTTSLPQYSALVTNPIKTIMGLPNSNLQWVKISNFEYEIFDQANTARKLVIKFLSFNPALPYTVSLNGIATFTDITSTSQNLFTMYGVDAAGVRKVTINGSLELKQGSTYTPVNTGANSLPTPLICQGLEYKVRDDLEALLKDVLLEKPFNSNIDLYQNPLLTALLQSYFPPNVTATSSFNPFKIKGGIYGDTLLFSIQSERGSCELRLHHSGKKTPRLFKDLVGFASPLTPYDYKGNAAFNFYIVGTYVVGNKKVQDTIWGYSCLPLKHCEPCPKPNPDCFTCYDWNIISPETSCSHQPLTFEIESDSCAGKPTMVWDFGDGTTSTMSTHTFTRGGDYYVTLSLINPTGCPDAQLLVASRIITVTNCDNPTIEDSVSWVFITMDSTTEPLPVDSCKEQYSTFLNIISQYNSFVTSHPESGLPLLNQTYSFSDFVNYKFCDCLSMYVSHLLSLMNVESLKGGQVINLPQLYIQNFCKPKVNAPCDPPVKQDTFFSPAYTPYTNPCVQYQLDLAYINAANAYQQYIDSLTTWISDQYNKHCLSAFESFSTLYKDKEYHFTLYYYDQAGNLIKTVPPEGVSIIDMPDTLDADYVKINKDRTYGTHTYFTDHTMATTYVYNSLNQLVNQSMPDHDMMNIWEYTLPSGLDSRLHVTGTQFVNSTKGFLSGYIDAGIVTSGNKRGYLYTTDDGGVTWTKMNDLVAADLKKVQMVDALNGFAVGQHGIVLKTTDGGASWDMISLVGINITTTLNDLFFTSPSNGIVIGDNGVLLQTVNGGITFTNLALPMMAGIQLNAITYDGYAMYIGGSNASGHGVLFKGPVSGATTSAFSVNWSLSASIRSVDLKRIQWLTTNTQKGFAIGVDGTLLKTIDGGSHWITIPTGTSNNFQNVYFKDDFEGVAILETLPGQGQIFKTNDGGVTWVLVSAAGDFYNDFYFDLKTTGTAPVKGYAVGKNGKVKRIVMSGNVGLVTIPTTPIIPSTANLISVYFSDPDHGWIASTTNVYYTNNATVPSPTWNPVTSVLPGGTTIREIYFSELYKTGVVLMNTGVLYRISAPASTTTYSFTAMNAPGNYVDLEDDATSVYGFDKNSGEIRKWDKSDLTVPPVPFGTAMSGISALKLASINAQIPNSIYSAGSGGELLVGTSSGWTDYSKNVTPLPVLDVQAVGTNSIWAVGTEGTLLQTTNGSDWRSLPSSSAVDFNAVKFNTVSTSAPPSSYNGLIAGENGLLLKSTITAGAVAFSTVSLSAQEDLYDVAINTAGKAYVAGAHGSLISIPDIVSVTPSFAVLKPAEDFKGLCFLPGANGLVTVGNNSALYQYNGTSGSKIKSVYTPALRDVHFINGQNGYVVGDNGLIRHTRDGGTNWLYLLAKDAAGNTAIPSPVLHGIWTTQPDQAVIIGDNGYIANTSGLYGTVLVKNTTLSTSKHLRAVGFNQGKGYIIGNNGAAYTSGNFGSTWSLLPNSGAITANLQAIHIFQNNHFMAVGDQRKIYCYNGNWIAHDAVVTAMANSTTPVTINPLTVFTDVYFHDDRTGYVVGSAGPGTASYVLRCSFDQNIQLSGQTSNRWTSMPLDGINGTTNGSNLDIRTIDFATRYHGFLGGSFYAGTPVNYARLVNDETNLFSTRFWYDRLGRMVVSQNTKQFNRHKNSSPQGLADYSYTLYDHLGRIKEVGEISDNAGPTTNFSTIFGEYIGQQYNPNVINDTKLLAWINIGTRREVTKTYYDQTAITGLPIAQENLRKRVVSVTYEDIFDGDDQTFQHGTHYTYDIHGNVNTLLQDNQKLYDEGVALASPALQAQRYKRIDYEYDLISGKVNLVRFQDGQPDAFYHFYRYDSDNRITDVYTSKYPQANTLINETVVLNHPLWDLDAQYFYYDHGPLERIEYGSKDNKVQGTDYAYTLQGWIKGVNSNVLMSQNDIGQDGLAGGVHGKVAKDAFSYTLNYHADDYKPIDVTKWLTAQRFEAEATGSDLMAARHDLYNGNISSMVTTLMEPRVYTGAPNEMPNILPQGTAYQYDQLNRLLEMKAFQNIGQDPLTASSFNKWGQNSNYTGKYHNTFTYDANGNILTQLRADAAGSIIDDLTYQYSKVASRTVSNRLYHVDDNIIDLAFTDDIDDQGSFNGSQQTVNQVGNNYRYDEIGNLSRDEQEEIEKIEWTVYGKIKSITRTSTSLRSELEFNYDASGNRIAKIEKPRDANGVKPSSDWITTYYTRDAQGNVMGIYSKSPSSSSNDFKLMERNLYGNSRLGSNNDVVDLITIPSQDTNRILGDKHYEGTNHLENILSIFSDRRIPQDNNGSGYISNFLTDAMSASDYSPFGVDMNGRKFGNTLRYGFNGKEKDNEIKGEVNSYDFGARIYDPRLGRWLAIDKIQKPDVSGYMYGKNNPIIFIDPDGNDDFYFNKDGSYLVIPNDSKNTYFLQEDDGNYSKLFNPTLSSTFRQMLPWEDTDGEKFRDLGENYSGFESDLANSTKRNSENRRHQSLYKGLNSLEVLKDIGDGIDLVIGGYGIAKVVYKGTKYILKHPNQSVKLLKESYEYSIDVADKIAKAVKTGDFGHNFPKLLDKVILGAKPLLKRADGRSEFVVKGSMEIGGKVTEGFYTITTKGNKITHRAFIAKDDWARYSKKYDLPSADKIK